jgi:hypothetical protein
MVARQMSGNSSDVPESPPIEGSSQPAGNAPAPRARSDRRILLAGVAVAIVIVVVVGFVAVLRAPHHTSPSAPAEILVPGSSTFSLAPDQSFGVTFIINSTGVLNTTYASQFGATVYLMSPTQYETLVNTYQAAGFAWENNLTGDGVVQYLTLTVHAGQWWFVMWDPSETVTTAVGLITPLTLTTVT